MRRALLKTLKRPARRLVAAGNNRLRPGIHYRRLLCEVLEDRRLLSVGPRLAPLEAKDFLGGLIDGSAVTAKIAARNEPTTILPGMELVDPSIDRFDGQIIYLDFDGEEDVTYNGPVTIEHIDVPAFSAELLGLAGHEHGLAEIITERVADILAPLGVEVTSKAPDVDEFSSIYIGGTDGAFAAYGHFNGLAETVDVGNVEHQDDAYVFSDEIAGMYRSAAEYSQAVADVVVHEAGHLLGLAHQGGHSHELVASREKVNLGVVLHDFAYTIESNQEAHQWITKEAYDFYRSQFDLGGFGELGTYLTRPGLNPNSSWSEIAYASLNYNGNNNIIEGATDEDRAYRNPFNQSMPYLRHFSAGGDGSEIYEGLWGNDSAYEQAARYWQSYVINNYSSNKSASYYYLGHVAHLLEDMTVPAHVHKDPHGGLIGGGDDEYEDWVGESNHFRGYDSGDAASSWDIYMPGSLVSLFRLTADYTDDYRSDDYSGDSPAEYSTSYRAPNRHHPGWITGSGELTAWECNVIADDLVPWAIEQVAGLFRLFYYYVDTSDPTAYPVNG